MNFGGSKWNSGGNECTILKSYKKIQKSFGGVLVEFLVEVSEILVPEQFARIILTLF